MNRKMEKRSCDYAIGERKKTVYVIFILFHFKIRKVFCFEKDFKIS